MRRFVWRLQRVLDVKEKQEHKARAELFNLTERLIEARGELLTQQKIMEDIADGLIRQNPRKRLGHQEFFLKHSATSDELIRKLKEKVRALEAEQREKVAEVLRLRRFKQGLERLREETKKQFIRDQERLEQKELDEGAGISFIRKAQQQEIANG